MPETLHVEYVEYIAENEITGLATIVLDTRTPDGMVVRLTLVMSATDFSYITAPA